MTLERSEDHISLVFNTDDIPLGLDGSYPRSIGISFLSPEHMMEVFQQITNMAAEVWPE